MNLLTNSLSPSMSVGLMEPEGILNAWTTYVRMISVRTSAIAIDCPHSFISRNKVSFFISFRLEGRQEGLLRDLHFPELLHSFFSFFLFSPELAFARNAPAVTLSGDIFPK